jgi:transcriptional regulator with XRE-family HTH domain
MTDLATRLLEVHRQKGLSQQQVAEIAGVHFTNVGKYERAEKNLKQIEVATYICVDKSAYSKIEKGLRALTVNELHKMAQLFNLTTDQIINYDGKILTEVILEDKTAVEQMRLIQQLEAEDKQTIFKLIDKMLTNKKFKDFFAKNIATL